MKRAAYFGLFMVFSFLYAGCPLEGIMEPPAITKTLSDMSLPDALGWIQDHPASNSEYTIVVGSDESVAPLDFSLKNKKNVTITIKSNGSNRLISLNTQGSLLKIGSGISLSLEENIELRGRNDNTSSLVNIQSGGTLVLNGGVIGNNKGGVIYDTTYFNSYYYGGAGVYISNEAKLIINSGSIMNNTVSGDGWVSSYDGGGILVDEYGLLEMNGGTIANNSSEGYGGGVYICTNGQVVMNGGIIRNNNGGYSGGGICVEEGGNFLMKGGEIYSNTSGNYGGGVYAGGVFKKTGGVIYGSNASASLKNVVASNSSNGAAVYTSDGKKRNNTANENVNLDSSLNGAVGGWE